MNLVVVSPINSPDGIAEYSRSLYVGKFSDVHFLANKDISQRLEPDSKDISRVWEWDLSDPSPISGWINERRPEAVHIQHHPAFFDLEALKTLLEQIDHTVKVFLTAHVVKSPGFDLAQIKNSLPRLQKIYIHNQLDYEYLIQSGVANAVHFVHPYWEFSRVSKSGLRKLLGINEYSPILATHGLIGAHKGLIEMAEAVASLKTKYPKLLWLAINALNPDNVDSASTLENLQHKITQLGISDQVILFTDFLPESSVGKLIQAADLGVLAYSEVGESASGAVRKFISAEVPTVVTDIPWMNEFSSQVYKIANKNPITVVQGISTVLESMLLQEKMTKACSQTVSKYGWTASAERLKVDYNL